jgi:hypothetical protein
MTMSPGISAIVAAGVILAAGAGMSAQPKGRAADAPTRWHICVGSAGWQDELAAAAKAYQKQHPEVTITFSNDYLNVAARLLHGEIDLANYTGDLQDHTGGPDIQKFSKGFPGESIERTIGYWPLAVVVPPGNAMASITMVQLHRLMTDPNARWADIGRPSDGRIRFYLYHSGEVQAAIAGYDLAANSNGGPRRTSHEEQMEFARAWNRHRVGAKLPDRGIPDLTDDPDGIAIWYHDKKLAASGYKILPVVAGSENRAYAPTDTAAVASGRYVLRTPLKVLIRASAPAHVKAFVEWLSTPEAAAAFKSGAEDTRHTRWPVAHVSEAANAPCSAPAGQHAAARPSVGGFDGTIAGAVAICPIQPLSTVFRMADRSHHAAYEKAIDDAIEADGRLKVVDRTQLSRVLDERRLQILGLDDAPGKPIVSADVLVISYVVTENLKTFLRIRAIHGPTGGVLSELKLPIDPAAPARFDPPLENSVRRWWPEVLGRLRDSRLKPSWVVLDVYPLSPDQLKPADALREALQSSLAADRSVFAPGDSALDDAQQEMLLRMLGLASPTGGRFAPTADYLVDARLLEGGKLEVRLRDAALKVMAEETFSGDADSLHPAATAWLKRQIAANPHKPTAATLPAGVIDEWARRQARVELEIARKLCARAGWRYDKSRQRWDVPLTTPANPEESSALRTAANRHARRAAQLDPTNEEAAYEAIPTLLGLMESWTAGDENAISLPTYVAPLERFLQAFPRSKHYEEILYRHAAACVYTGSRDRFPVGTDAAVRLALIRRGLESYARYMELYRIKGTPSPDYQAVMCFDHYLYHLQTYINVGDPPEKELESIVADWSRRFDSHVEKAVHSDFVRLIVLNHKRDRAGFIELLTKMQQRWPDPKHPQWEQGKSIVDRMISSLFAGVDSSNSSFQLWHRGLRGIGDIPKKGYREEEDKPKYRAALLFGCPEAGTIPEALRAAGEQYRKLQPGVEVAFWAGIPGKKMTYLTAAEDRLILIVAGPLTDSDRKALEELYCGKLSMRRIGYFRGRDNAAPREVSILLPPGRGKSEVLDDFLHFLETPAGSKALADHGVYPSADAPASQPATQPAQATTPLGKTAPGE